MEPLFASVVDASRLLGVGRTTLYRLIGEGQLETVKIGRRRLIKTVSLHRLANAVGPADPVS